MGHKKQNYRSPSLFLLQTKMRKDGPPYFNREADIEEGELPINNSVEAKQRRDRDNKRKKKLKVYEGSSDSDSSSSSDEEILIIKK